MGAFSYIVLLLNSKGQLATPGLAVFNLTASRLCDMAGGFLSHLVKVLDMPERALPERFLWCRTMNTWICTFSATTGLFAITRIFHIGNINMFRYLGYCFTCPLMQAE